MRSALLCAFGFVFVLGCQVYDPALVEQGPRDANLFPQRDSGPGEQNACGGFSVLEIEPNAACGPCGLGRGECQGSDSSRCGMVPELTQITESGSVRTSGTFENNTAMYGGILAIDGDPATSWFSDGPAAGDQPSEFTWTHQDGNVCIGKVDFVGNDMHPRFRQNFGFAALEIQLLDVDQILAEDTRVLTGTPDPDQSILFEDGVMANRVRLLLSGHEDTSCGGFAELVVSAYLP